MKFKLLNNKLENLDLEDSDTEIKQNSTLKCLVGKNQFSFNKVFAIFYLFLCDS